MTTHLRRALCIVTMAIITVTGWADHALLTDGHIVYNVMIPDGASTGGMLVRIRTTQSSFEFDPRANAVTLLPPHSIIKGVADYVRTTDRVGRDEAVALFQQRSWGQYHPAPREPLIAPTPSPKATPVPVNFAQATPIPLNVVPADVPLQARLERQLDIFMKEQSKLSQDAVTSAVSGLLTADRIQQIKIELVERQKMILQQYFPQNAETVTLAVKYWGEQVDKVRQTGKFDLENL